MKKLKIKGTPKTPDFFLNPNGELKIEGVSVPENSMGFYKPIIDWISEYVKSPANETVLSFKLEYINTSSLQFVYDILSLLAEIKKTSNSIRVDWYYMDDDIDMKETGDDYNETIDIPFNFIEVPED